MTPRCSQVKLICDFPWNCAWMPSWKAIIDDVAGRLGPRSLGPGTGPLLLSVSAVRELSLCPAAWWRGAPRRPVIDGRQMVHLLLIKRLDIQVCLIVQKIDYLFKDTNKGRCRDRREALDLSAARRSAFVSMSRRYCCVKYVEIITRANTRTHLRGRPFTRK